jgi:hypothetical protein
MLMQLCHGAPGFVVCLAHLPSRELDPLLLAGGEAIWAAGPLAKDPICVTAREGMVTLFWCYISAQAISSGSGGPRLSRCMASHKPRRMRRHMGNCATRCGPAISAPLSTCGTVCAARQRSRRWMCFTAPQADLFDPCCASTSGCRRTASLRRRIPPPQTPRRSRRPNIGKFHDVERSVALQKIVVHGTKQPFHHAVPHSTIRN